MARHDLRLTHSSRAPFGWSCAGALLLAACSSPGTSVGGLSAGAATDGATGSATDGASGGTGGGATAGASSAGSDGSASGGPKFDVGSPLDGGGGGGGGASCQVPDDGIDAPGDCMETAPPDSFEPEVQWGWWGDDPDPHLGMRVTAAVANLTDDNDDGAIDLCDTPDVIALVGWSSGFIYALDGASGTEHWKSPIEVRDEVHPAVGDIDGDGLPEIVAMTLETYLVAFEHDGTLKWQGADPWDWTESNSSALALADLDNDGDVEILGGHFIFDHEGNLEVQLPGSLLNAYSATTAADLDGDGDLEVLAGPAAWHHDGTPYWQSDLFNPDIGYPQIANLDGDPEPEVLFMNRFGGNERVVVFEHDGAVKYDKAGGSGAAVTIHDFDGDLQPEFTSSVGDTFVLHEADGTVVWQRPKPGGTWSSSGTAFDFLGDGSAEAVTGDATTLQILDGVTGDVLLQVPRSSGTGLDYEIVADVDNDGAAEIVVQGSRIPNQQQSAPSVEVLHDAQDRWVPARRIWNQHTYHVTNVREDGTIPQFEPPNWQTLNTFRTQAQAEGGAVCKPVPEG